MLYVNFLLLTQTPHNTEKNITKQKEKKQEKEQERVIEKDRYKTHKENRDKEEEI